MSWVDRRSFLAGAAGGLLGTQLLPELGVPWKPAEPQKVGLIGAGRQGREILGELAKFENVEVSAVVEPEAVRLGRSLRRTKAAKGYPNLDAALAAESATKAWIVATPTHLHKEPVLALLRAGHHVYCEAPLASTREDAVAIVQAARGAQSKLHVGFLGRTNPVYKLARSFYRSGSIGRWLSGRALWRRKSNWRTAVSDPADDKKTNWRLDPAVSLGLLGEESSHQLDTLLWFVDKRPIRVRGGGAGLLHGDGRTLPDTIRAQFLFEGGVEVAVDATLGSSFEGSHELLDGSMGTIKLSERHGWLFKEADAPIQGWEVYASRQQFHQDEGITLIADATKLAAQGKLKEGIGLPHPPLYFGLESFLKAVAENQPPAVSAEDAFAATVLAIAGHEAIRGNHEVEISAKLFEVGG